MIIHRDKATSIYFYS